MTPIIPLVQPPVEDLRNGIQIAESWAEDINLTPDQAMAFRDTARLIRAALEKLGEPHPVTVEAAQTFLPAVTTLLTHGLNVDCPLVQLGTWTRCLGHAGTIPEARDVAAAITRTALTWEAPQ